MNDSHSWQRYSNDGWLPNMICISQLDSDLLIVLDYLVEGLVGTETPGSIKFLHDDDNSWARYPLLLQAIQGLSLSLAYCPKC